MENRFPVKSIITSSICFAFSISFLLLILSMLEESDPLKVLIKVVSTFMLIIAISLSNIGIIVLLAIKRPVELKKKIWIFYILSTVSSIFLLILTYLISAHFTHVITLRVTGNMKYLYISFQAVLLQTIVLLFQGLVLVQDSNNKARMENLMLKSAQSEAAYQMLLQQIHPHFLFNALNILKALYKKQPALAENYLGNLSHFLRASLTTDKTGLSKLSRELELCQNYLEMQKIRFGEALIYQVDIPDQSNPECQLPVFSLQTLIENAIKHNGLTESEPLQIIITQENDWIMVKNNIKYISSKFSNGHGLTNLAERYRLLSNEQIKIFNDGKEFCVSIKIIHHQA